MIKTKKLHKFIKSAGYKSLTLKEDKKTWNNSLLGLHPALNSEVMIAAYM